MHIEFQRFGGLSPALMNRAGRLVLDLSGKEADEVRALIPQSFWTMKSEGGTGRADAFSYEILVNDEGHEHRAILSEADLDRGMRPLMEWLRNRVETRGDS